MQCDEIWSFVHCKAANTPEHLAGVPGIGDTWVWTAIDADSKLMIAWEVGDRDTDTAHDLMRSVAARVAGRIQITTDGFRSYPSAIANYFDVDTRSDYASLVRIFLDRQGARMKRHFHLPEKKFLGALCCTLAGLAVVWKHPSDAACIAYLTTTLPLWVALLVTQHLGERRDADRK